MSNNLTKEQLQTLVYAQRLIEHYPYCGEHIENDDDANFQNLTQYGAKLAIGINPDKVMNRKGKKFLNNLTANKEEMLNKNDHSPATTRLKLQMKMMQRKLSQIKTSTDIADT